MWPARRAYTAVLATNTGIDFAGQGQHGVELVLRLCVEGVVQATGCGELRQLVLGRQRVSHATRFVERVGRRQQRAAQGLEELKVGHVTSPCGVLFVRSFLECVILIATGVPARDSCWINLSSH
jgi:hypothetical protein